MLSCVSMFVLSKYNKKNSNIIYLFLKSNNSNNNNNSDKQIIH